jgi:uncharacterized protein
MSNKIVEEISRIEEEIKKTPYHKGTEHQIGRLRAKISRLKEQIRNQESKKSQVGGEGYGVKKQGDATAVLIGPPSVGKSTLLNQLTGAKSKVGEYDFTTLNVIPGMFKYKGAQIQLLDLPGLIIGASRNKGDGQRVLSVARNSDLIILISDVEHLDWISRAESELYNAGIRLNQKRPHVQIERKTKGGIKIIYPFTYFQKKTINEIGQQFGLKNAKITVKEDIRNIDRLVDAFSENRVYLPSMAAVNKIDLKNHQQLNLGKKDFIKISAQQKVGFEKLKEKMWDKLNLIRVYLKPQINADPDYKNPLILKQGNMVKDALKAVSNELLSEVNEVLIWGEKAKYPGQLVSFDEPLFDEAIVYFKK